MGRKRTTRPDQEEVLGEVERLRLALSAVDAVAYEWLAHEDAFIWSGNPAPLLGAMARHPVTTSKSLFEALPAEIARTRETVLYGQTDNATYRFEFPVETEDRRVRWLEDRGQRLKDGDGAVVRHVGVIRDITENKRAEARLRYLASFDELTGHLNRARLRQALQETLSSLSTGKTVGAYMLVGIDHLTLVNETYGYETADQVIVAVGHRISGLLRDGDVLGRSAGNKFGLVLPNRSAEEVIEMARALREIMRSAIIETPRGAVCATVSIGAVMLPDGAATSEEAMAHAEEALHLAKRAGRDSFRLYEVSAQRKSVRQRMVAIADQVVAALNERRIVLAYQPIVSAEDQSVLLHESLLRLVQPDGLVVTAGEFIPISERVGLISLVDQRALELAVDTLRRYPDQHLSLNVSGMTASDSAWLEAFLAHIRAHRDIASRLTIELTETAALQDLQTSARFMASLRGLGCKIAIDDFGAGYTSFRNLQVFEVDMVKIDGAFVKGLIDSADNQLFVRTLVGLAKNFGLTTVAEWVSNEEEASLLRSFGVDAFQGFHFGRPLIAPSWIETDKAAPRSKVG